jgi:hypothetical protein
MFVQVIEGRTSDAKRLLQQFERWTTDLQPGATGYLGSTGGVTADGRVVMFARFESDAAARANSERPEQGQWWAETAKCFDGDVAFADSSDVEIFLAGGSDDAGFVQVMKSPDVDRQTVTDLDAAFEPIVKTYRPDLIGGLRIWTGPRACVDVNYFTSEQAARAAESQEPPAEVAELLSKFMETMKDAEFIDLPNPQLISA